MPARARPAKKPKQGALDGPSLAVVRVSLSGLPFEILAEILLCTRSPPTVLAVSRTCSFLYRTLAQNRAASFIWRSVRKTCEPCPLPEPAGRWKRSEADYAAFVFSGGVCDVCHKATRAMYTSFAAQIRLCGNWHCRQKFLKEFLVDISAEFPAQDRRSLWVPVVESCRCFHRSSTPISTWPHLDNLLVRKTDWEKFQLDLAAYEAAEQAQASGGASTSLAHEDDHWERVMGRCNVAIQMFPLIMELSVDLISWKTRYDMEYEKAKQVNRLRTEHFARIHGWKMEDLVSSQAYASLQKRKNFLLEEIMLNDVLPIQPMIESELVAMRAHRMRQKSEAAYRTKLTELKKVYERMRCGTVNGTSTQTLGSDPLILPSLSVFFTLPSVRVLKGSPDSNTMPPDCVFESGHIRSSPLATSLIISDIHNWLVPVQTYLMGLLGYPNGWESAGTRILPPLKRVTARFFCRRCGEGRVGRGYQRQLSLDFKGVCSHVCVAAQKRSVEGPSQQVPQEGGTGNTVTGYGKGRKSSEKKHGVKTPDWVVNMFEPDKRAIRFTKTILKLTGQLEEDPSTATDLDAMGGTIRCKTCVGWIVMDFDTAIGHARRHESMDIELLAMPLSPCTVGDLMVDPAFTTLQLAFQRGTTELLMGSSYRARNLCKKANYGCKHCLPCLSENIVLGAGHPVKRRAMDFNGVRSHVKEKHGIQDIRDEDFFCYSPIQIDDGKSCQE